MTKISQLSQDPCVKLNVDPDEHLLGLGMDYPHALYFSLLFRHFADQCRCHRLKVATHSLMACIAKRVGGRWHRLGESSPAVE
jgi:hypothetical protein